jgi:hypothetical protein
MWALFVIFHSPGRDPAPRIKEIHEPTRVQAFIPELTVEALDSPVLRRFTRLNVNRASLVIDTPGEVMPAGQFRSVV